jgi:hypothetical protein
MTKVIIETKPTLSKVDLQALNRRRWTQYAERLTELTKNSKLGYRSLMILMGSINARERWLRISREEFDELLPKWTEAEEQVDWSVTRSGMNILLHVYRDPKSDKYYFSRLFVRGEHPILKGWHVAALNGIRSRGVVMTPELSNELYLIGSKIVDSIRMNEGVWRKVNNPMLEQQQPEEGV